MINVGIVGYGNLGKAVENEIINNENLNLVGIFSRRKLNHRKTFLYEQYNEFINKIDVMIMCGGSEKDLPIQSKELAKHFNIIDTFDNHSQIKNHYSSIKETCEKSKTNAIVCCGWDPGLFSCFRVLFNSILNNCECFYGRGISLGHTNALRKIKGIKNAVQYTLPNKQAVSLAKQGKPVLINKHFRLCYVVSSENNKTIINKIKSTPHYFKNQKVKVKFISEKSLEKKNKLLAHKGKIFSVFNDNNNKINISLKMKTTSNPTFTAKIVVAYINAISHMVKNKLNTALTPLQIPLIWLSSFETLKAIENFC